MSRLHRCPAASFALLTLATLAGCSVFGADDPPEQPTSTTEAPPPVLDGVPAEQELTEAFGVFVAPTGSRDGDGSRARPLAGLQQAITQAASSKKRVYLCEGTYREALTLVDGVSIVGGLDCAQPRWRLGGDGARSRVQAPSSPAITARELTTTTRLEALQVEAPYATQPGASSIGLLAESSPGLTVARSSIEAGNGAHGADGAPAIQLRMDLGADGAVSLGAGPRCGTPPSQVCLALDPTRFNGGEGGRSVCLGAPGHDGAPGGRGGSGGLWKGFGYQWVPYNHDPATFGAVPGDHVSGSAPGADGAAGTHGRSATTTGRITASGFVPSDGTDGTDGEPGSGGSGGDGLIPQASATDKAVWMGEQGSGGGAGGCPGLAGTAGKGGGASIGALVLGAPPAFDRVALVSRDGGRGGKGTFGSVRSVGGRGGVRDRAPLVTQGYPGGAGGRSGISGSGAGGSTFALAFDGAAPAMQQVTTQIGAPGAGVAAMTAEEQDAVVFTKEIPASVAGDAAEIHAPKP